MLCALPFAPRRGATEAGRPRLNDPETIGCPIRRPIWALGRMKRFKIHLMAKGTPTSLQFRWPSCQLDGAAKILSDAGQFFNVAKFYSIVLTHVND